MILKQISISHDKDDRCTAICKFVNNSYHRRIRRRLNLGHIFREKSAFYGPENAVNIITNSINYWKTWKLCVSLRVLFAATNTQFVQTFLQNLRRLWRAGLLLAECSKYLLLYCVPAAKDFPSWHFLLLI